MAATEIDAFAVSTTTDCRVVVMFAFETGTKLV